MEKIQTVVHWSVYAYYIYLFGYASLFKVFQKASMMKGMEAFGFNKGWTLFIGYGELLGVLGLLIGIGSHQVKNVATIWLLFFAVGALMVHFAHKDYNDFYGALFGCIAAVVILTTDKYFKLVV